MSKFNIINVNGSNFSVQGKNISVVNDKIFVDGKEVVGNLPPTVHVKFEGDIANLEVVTATISGNVLGNVEAVTVNCKDVGGNVDATTVNANNITGDVDAVTVKHSK